MGYHLSQGYANCSVAGNKLKMHRVPSASVRDGFGAVRVSVQTADTVKWTLHQDWFGATVQVWEVIYDSGAQAPLQISGPGLDAPQMFNVGTVRPGNKKFPGGEWVGKFTGRPLKRKANENSYEPVFGLKLKIACE